MSAEEGSVAAPLSQGEVSAEPQEGLTPLRVREGGELGRGGMARVRSGFDPLLERPVALKRGLAGTPEDDARLLREAKLTARLDHPSIAPVLDVGLDESGAPVCVLPVRQGASFLDAVKQPQQTRASLLRSLLAASHALAHAHARGVVHRDVSPANVRLGADGAVWLLDWGLAATLDEAAAGGFRGGTPGYTAPELCEGAPASCASDVWSLGALLHLLCAHAPPPELLTRPASCPRALWAVCTRALSAAPAQRYADARAFAAELTRFLDGQPVEAWPEGPVDTLLRITARRPKLTLAFSLAALLLLGASLLALRAQEKEAEALALLLRDSAERALHLDDVVSARRLAREALALRDDVRTRGILAALRRTPAATEVPLAAAPCPPRFVDDVGPQCAEDARLADGTVITLERNGTSNALTFRDARLTLGGGGPAVTVNAARTLAVVALPGSVTVLSLPVDGSVDGPVELTPCAPGHNVRFAVPWKAGAFVYCADDELVFTTPVAVARRLRVGGLGGVFRGANAGDLLDDERLLVGAANGQAAIIDLSNGALTWVVTTALGRLHTVVAAADGRTAVLAGDKGAALLRVREGQLLPLEGTVSGVWRRGGRGFTVARGTALSTLTPPDGLSTTRGLHGRAALAVNDGARRVAVGDSMGTVELSALHEGVQEVLPGYPRVIKSLAFSADGRFLAVAAAGAPGVVLYDVAGPARRLATPWDDDVTVRARHVAFFDARCFVLFGWTADAWGACWNGEDFEAVQVPRLPGEVYDVAARAGALWLAAGEGGVWKLKADFTMTQVTAAPARHLAVNATGFVASDEAQVQSLALADDGRRAACLLDGSVELRDGAGAVLFLAPAHEQRCARVSFCDAERALCSVGWDGRLRVLEGP